jgi:uncharacterized protein YndB with AHSA1/START domain
MRWPLGWRPRLDVVVDEAGAAVVSRLLPARPQDVWHEWVDADAMADWMCPWPARCLGVQLEPVVGGNVRIDIEEDGFRFFVAGRCAELDPPRRLAFTWSCSTWLDPNVESQVTVTLDAVTLDEPRCAGTLMTIEHALLPPDLRDRHQAGWAAIANQLMIALQPD